MKTPRRIDGLTYLMFLAVYVVWMVLSFGGLQK